MTTPPDQTMSTGEGAANGADVGGSTLSIHGYQDPDVIPRVLDIDTLTRLEHNDPDVVGLSVDGVDDFFQGGNDNDDYYGTFQRLGRAIGNSMYLRTVNLWRITRPPVSNNGLFKFFRSFSQNSTIEFLSIDGDHFDEETFLDVIYALEPFIARNHNLRCIKICEFHHFPASSFISVLLTSPVSKLLKRIDLSDNRIGESHAANIIIDIINGMSSLHSLVDLNLKGNCIGKEGCEALAGLLKNSASQIYYLALGNNFIDDECMDILIGAWRLESSALKTLDFDYGLYLSSEGWEIFSSFLSNANCSIGNLLLGENNMTDENFTAFGGALSINKKLKCLYLFDECFEVTLQGWLGFSTCLQSDHSELQELYLSACNIDDDSATHLFSALATNTSLKILKMEELYSITPDGWFTCIRLLENSKSVLEELDFSLVNFGDKAVTMLGKVLLYDIITVRSLRVFDIPTITRNGWPALACVVDRNSGSKLKKLIVGCEQVESCINDLVFSLFAYALRNNNSLEVLELGAVDVTSDSFNLLLLSLCDCSSINSVFDSNHTLTEFTCGWNGERSELASSLQNLLHLNKNENKSEVALFKSFMYFASNIENVGKVFSSIELSVLPHAIGCIGKNSQVGIPTLYNVFKTNPWIFDVQSFHP